MDNTNLRHTSTTRGLSPDEENPLLSRFYESKAEKKTRWRSLVVPYVTTFVMSVGFSIVLTGVWPYMQTLNKDVGKEYVGWVVAAHPFAQVLASPLLGLWGNKTGGVRIPCMVTAVVFILGNALYSLLPALKGAVGMATYYGMIVARLIVGVSSASMALARTYIASATTLKERTVAISIIAGCQALGFVIGPVIQALLTTVIPEEVDTGIPWLRWDQYTSCSWVAAAMGVINLIILMPCVFKEHNISAKELAMMKTEGKNVKLPKPDMMGIIVIMFSHFIANFYLTISEALAEPLVQDAYGWSDNLSVIVTGVAFAVGALWSFPMFSLSGYLCQKYSERKVLLFLGFPLMFVGSFLLIPIAGDTIPRKCQNETTTILPYTTLLLPNSTNLPNKTTFSPSALSVSATMMTVLSSTGSSATEPKECQLFGCPYEEQPWCAHTPQLPLPQLGIAYFIAWSGFPICFAVCQSIFSKMLGPKPQGVWMGLLTGVGGMSRILGPIFVTYVYKYYGTYTTFGVLTAVMALVIIELICNYKRLVPMIASSTKLEERV